MQLTVRMLGTRGVPAMHGGFETAAENIGLELVRRGWRVIVYCQTPGTSTEIQEDTWRGIERVHLPERFNGALGTIWFDAHVVQHAARHRDLCLTFGYNTAFLNARLRAKGITSIINMDGIEWQRARWSPMQRRFLQLNERIACRIGDHLIADHPEIRKHLATVAPDHKLSTIAYGAPAVEGADPAALEQYGLDPGRYLTLIARPVAENTILEMVASFSRKRRGVKLLVLGDYSSGEYQRQVRAAASDEVVFAGAVYDVPTVQALRFHSLGYLHGHTVGGTNPSLVEALGCGNAVIAHDNRYNRWVAQDAALYFSDPDGFERALVDLIGSPALQEMLSARARDRHKSEFDWDRITDRYEELLLAHVPAGERVPQPRPAFTIPVQRRSSSERPASPVTGRRSLASEQLVTAGDASAAEWSTAGLDERLAEEQRP